MQLEQVSQRWLLGKRLFVLCAVIVLGVMLAGCGSDRDARSPASLPKHLSFVLPDLQGKMVKPEDFHGQVVLVDFWASWCEPCKLSLPFYAKLYKKHAAQGLTILAINADEDDDTVKAFLAETPLPFTILRDPKNKLADSLKLPAMPTMFLIDRAGAVVFSRSSFEARDEAEINKRVEQLVAAKAD